VPSIRGCHNCVDDHFLANAEHGGSKRLRNFRDSIRNNWRHIQLKWNLNAHLLVQPFKGVGFDNCDFIPIEREYLQRVESLEVFIVDRGDSVVVQVQD